MSFSMKRRRKTKGPPAWIAYPPYMIGKIYYCNTYKKGCILES